LGQGVICLSIHPSQLTMAQPYTVIRRKGRRTASLTVAPDNTVAITVPAELSDAAVEALIRRKQNWIYRKIAFNSEVRFPHKPKEYVSGEAFSYIGRNYRLKVVAGGQRVVELKAGKLYVQVPAELKGQARTRAIREALAGWYREHALEKLTQRARLQAEKMGLKISAVGIRDYRRQWGSCLQNGSILFNWKVVLAPLRTIDYVVIHELCHLVHRNHSPKYWKLLALHLPDYAESKEWLRVNGGLLEV
jgi:predicted metal-dependent hydrolase